MACLLLFAGCYRPPQVAPGNLEVISSLRTALSTRNPQRLTENEQVLIARHSQGELSDSELEAFQDLIALARAGDWEKAEQRVVQFQRAQRPTQEQIDRLPKPKKSG
ncbi:MAG: hypothetical protein AB7U73_05435 [Pirellulales bacterium]